MSDVDLQIRLTISTTINAHDPDERPLQLAPGNYIGYPDGRMENVWRMLLCDQNWQVYGSDHVIFLKMVIDDLGHMSFP